jgi:hypothetical protein
METFEITLESAEPVDLGELGSDGFETLLESAGVDSEFTWEMDEDGRIRVTFRHEAVDRDRAQGVSDRIASGLGPAVWTAHVEAVAPS